MRLDPIFDSLYILGFLGGELSGSQVCLSSAPALSRAVYEVAWTPGPEVPTGVTAFVEVNVVPMDREQVLPNQTVLVEGGRITTLGPSAKVPVPAGAVRIDGRGKYLIPGLAEMHMHGIHESWITKETATLQGYLFDNLADGVTTIRTLAEHRSKTGPSADDVQRLRSFTPSPRMYHARAFPKTTRPDSLAALVAAAKAAGYPLIGAPYWSPKTPEEQAVLDSLIAVSRRVGLPMAVHSHRLSFETVLAVGSTGGSIEHLSGVFWDSLGFWDPRLKDSPVEAPAPDLHVSKIQPMAMALQRAGVWITPTLKCLEGHPRFTPAHDAIMRRIVKTLQEVGVGMFLAADDRFDVHDELTELVRAGLTPYQALLTGTRNPARYLGQLDSSGTVAVGKRADLVLLSGNPLADIRHARGPAGVMIAGRWIDRAELDQGLFPSLQAWLAAVLNKRIIAEEGVNIKEHGRKLQAVATSLAATQPSERRSYERLLWQFAAELGALRAVLKPEQQDAFDPLVRVWLRVEGRNGYQVVVPGVTSIS